MKLKSKEQCPISVRDRLVKNFANQDIGIMDMKKALEIAEGKCFELDKENMELKKKYLEAEHKAVELHEVLDKCTRTVAELLTNDQS